MSLPEIIPSGISADTDWWEQTRRPELLRLFAGHVYGITPPELPEASYTLENRPCRFPSVDNSVLTIKMSRNGFSCSFRCDVYRPAGEPAPLPAVIMINPFSQRPWDDDKIYSYCPPDVIAEAGFVAVNAYVDQACADHCENYRQGLMELYPPRGESGWGAIGGWAFCASRVIDYLQLQSNIKHDCIAVCGCSRAGKTALWCGAQDTRAAVTISIASGCTGAAVTRGKTGERIADITRTCPHWFCARYAGYSNREEELPIDQHMLLSLCAPRPLYVSSASADEWADPRKEFEAAVLCGEAYRLYGKQGLSEVAFPAENTPLLGGSVGYHVRRGDHGCEVYDWEQILSFMQKSFEI